MTSAVWHVGDALTVLRTLPDASVDLILTSPPFLALRSYLPADDPNKGLEMGSESTPGEFVDRLLDVIEELARVLAPHGSLAVELGDTYAGSGGAGGDYDPGGWRDGQPRFEGSGMKYRRTGEAHPIPDRNAKRQAGGSGWPLAKSLVLGPELLRVALVYGINPLTGRPTPRWRLRNTVTWCRPNPAPGYLADKFRPATSDLMCFCKGDRRYFDLDGVRQPYSENSHKRTAGHLAELPRTAKTAPDGNRDTLPDRNNDDRGAPPLDFWVIATEGYPGSHYATWPSDLLTIPIIAMSPERVCRTCGKPSERIAETTNPVGVSTGRRAWREDETTNARMHSGEHTVRISSAPTAQRRTLGFTDCGHGDWRPGVVLDPFAGSGTTLAVATGHGRDAIGIDLDRRNFDLAVERVGPLLLTLAG